MSNEIFIDFNKYLSIAKQIELEENEDVVASYLRSSYADNNFHDRDKPNFSEKKGGLFNLSSTTISFKFSHRLIKSGINEWNIIENIPRGKGGFGEVCDSRLKIRVENKKASIIPVMEVVKIQRIHGLTHFDKKVRFDEAKKEAEQQMGHSVNVKAVVTDAQKIEDAQNIFIISADCGVSLDKLLISMPPSLSSFDKKLLMAQGICNEILFLKQRGIVHRDLKPANICYKEVSSGVFQIILIDFGLAETVDAKNVDANGTILYMAPELEQADQGPSYASDMYALSAILGELFGAKDIFKYKHEIYKKLIQQKQSSITPILKAPYCLEGLFDECKPTKDIYIDPLLLDDIQFLLKQLHDNNTEKRPTIEYVCRFFTSISYRREAYRTFLDKWEIFKANFDELAKLCCDIGIDKNLIKLDAICSKTTKNKPSASHFLRQVFEDQQNLLIEKITSLSKEFKSHMEVVEKLVKQNRSAQEYDMITPFPSPSLSTIRMLISDMIIYLKKIQTSYFNTKSYLQDSKFKGTNSSGIKKIQAILKGNKPPLIQLEEICKIAKSKVKPGFSLRYSRSHLFGKGRHKNVDILYQQLAEIHTSTGNNKSLIDEKLNLINKHLSCETFVHNK